jgi:hypothetical protein
LNRIDDSRDLRGEEVVIYYSYISDSPKQCMSKERLAIEDPIEGRCMLKKGSKKEIESYVFILGLILCRLRFILLKFCDSLLQFLDVVVCLYFRCSFLLF